MVHTLMKCRMMVFHQITRVKKTCTEKYILQLKCSRLYFLKTFLVPYEFTGFNLRIGIMRFREALYRGRTLEGVGR